MPREAAGASLFNEAAAELLRRVAFRRADDPEIKRDIYRLRYRSYLREGAIGPNPDRRFEDRYDLLPNTASFGVFVDDNLAASLRLSISRDVDTELPGMTVFPDILGPMLAAGNKIIDPTRFVVDEAFGRMFSKLPYVTLKIIWMALDYFEADTMLATVRTEHQAFYRRFFGHRLLCPARPYPSLLKPICLMTLDYTDPAVRDRVNQRYPFMLSTEAERDRLFAPQAALAG